MSQPYTDGDVLIASIFSDGTELFRQPPEPEPGDTVTVRLRLQKGAEVHVTMMRDFPAEHTPMRKARSDDMFDWYELRLDCWEKPIRYSFLIEWEGRLIHFNRLGARWVDCVPLPAPNGSFQILPGFHVPDWAKGALQYQILPDRFRNGNPRNDVRDHEYAYARGHIRHADAWNALPEEDDYRCQYGGDLEGVLEKLDYLQSLGVEAIYFNPIFVSPSPHKYDAQDYEHVDPHLTVIPKDGGKVLIPGDHDNARATRYIARTTLPDNLAASDAWFADFCREVHRRGMKIILDGVFNHCGSFHRWMNREGLYAGDEGAYGHPHSPYRGFFRFKNDLEYDSWWGIDTLPKLYYEQSQALCEAILRIGEKWASPPYSIDGWRLDVAADLGHSRSFNHLFWKEFRRRVKAVNPDLVIIAEHYGDPSEWLGGDEWDTVMNYDAFMDPLSFFLTGLEKHSDYRRDDLYQNGEAFFSSILRAMAALPTPSLYSAMDQLSNHDHSRFMTRTNGRVGRLKDAGPTAASIGIRPAVFREAAVIQMTWPGAPTLYYGDEAGLVGWTDPDNRRAYPWGHEDKDLIDMFRELARVRQALPVLRRGSVKPLAAGFGHIAYARFDEEACAVVVCNNTDAPLELSLPLQDIGLPDGTLLFTRFNSLDQWADTAIAGVVSKGFLRFHAPANTAVILSTDRR